MRPFIAMCIVTTSLFMITIYSLNHRLMSQLFSHPVKVQFNKTRFDYITADLHPYSVVNEYVGRVSGKPIYLTDPASSSCFSECTDFNSEKRNTLKRCISTCKINPLETCIYTSHKYPQLYYGRLRSRQVSATSDPMATNSIQTWLAGGDNRSLLERVSHSINAINIISLEKYNMALFKRPLELENNTIALYLTSSAEKNLSTLLYAIKISSVILYQDLARLSQNQNGLGVYLENGTMVTNVDAYNYDQLVLPILGVSAREDFFAFGPRGRRALYYPHLTYKNAYKWSSSYNNYDKSFYFNKKKIFGFNDPIEAERDIPILSKNGDILKCDARITTLSNKCNIVLSTNIGFNSGKIYLEAIYNSNGKGYGALWFSTAYNPMKLYETIPYDAVVPTKHLRRLHDGDTVMLLIDLDRGIYHIGRNGDWAAGMNPLISGKKISETPAHYNVAIVIGASLSDQTNSSSWTLVPKSNLKFKPSVKINTYL